MSILTEDGDRISPSHLDVRVLIALSNTSLNSYQIVRHALSDADNHRIISNGSIRPSIARLEASGLIKREDAGYYSLTSLGADVLEIELKRLERLVRLAQRRRRA